MGHEMTDDEDNITRLIKALKGAYDECWAAKFALSETAKRHAPLCIELLHELGYIPKLINRRIERRIQATDGADTLGEDFWSDPDMIIALSEYFMEEYETLEELHVSSSN